MYTQKQIDEANGKDIREVAEGLDIELKGRGRNKFCLCISHSEKTASMVVGGKRNECHCYSCGVTYSPISLVMKVKKISFKEAVKYLINEEGEHETGKRRKKKIKAEPAPLPDPAYLYHVDKSSGELIADPHYKGRIDEFLPNMDNSLSVCLRQKFPYEVVNAVTQRYGLGLRTDRTFVRGTMFPCIDLQGRCHNIKVQEYDTHPESERFMHRKPATLWLGAILQRDGMYEQGPVFDTRALFGEHLLVESGMVALVESPKNAVVGACRWPDLIWVAVGNKGALTAEMLRPLQGRDVLVFPDKDALTDWQARIDKLQHLANFRFSTDWMDEVGEKGDIADWVMGELKIKNLELKVSEMRRLNCAL